MILWSISVKKSACVIEDVIKRDKEKQYDSWDNSLAQTNYAPELFAHLVINKMFTTFCLNDN